MKKSIIPIMVMILLIIVSAVSGLMIGNIRASPLSDTSAEINWTSDAAGDSKLLYGLTSSVSEIEYSAMYTQYHSVILSSLQAETEYYYSVETGDGTNVVRDDNSGSFYRFTTPIKIFISDIIPGNIGVDTAEISWVTDIESGSKVVYGLTQDNLDKSAVVDGKTKEHKVKLETLANGTTYLFKVVSDYAESDVRSFTTRADISPPVIYGFSVPEFYNKDVLDITGITKPNSDIYVYQDNRLIRQGKSRDTGEFSFNYIRLEKDVNTFRLKVIDQYGEEFEKEYTTTIDKLKPNFTINQLPDSLQQATQRIDGTVDEPVTVSVIINNKTVELNVTEKFSELFSLEEGDNKVIIAATDRAGNVVEYVKNIYSDSKDPVLEMDQQIASYSPSIGQNIRLKGKVNEPAEIMIKVNDRTYKTNTKEDLTWEQVIELERKIDLTGTSATIEQRADISPQYENKIELYAVDRSGRESRKSSGVIIYKLCGTGGDWDIVIGKPSPGAISPFDLKRGTGMIGFEINLVWRGAGDSNTVRITGTPQLRKFTQVGSGLMDQYSLQAMGPVSANFLRTQGYATIQLAKTDKFEELEFLKFPLEMDIQYSYDQFGTQVAARQQTCITVDALIDKTFTESKIPEKFVKNSIEFLNKTIEALDTLIDPVKKVEKFLFIGCKVMQIKTIFVRADEIKSCYAFTNRIPYSSQKDAEQNPVAIKDVEDCDSVSSASLKSNFGIVDTELQELCRSCMTAKKKAEEAKHQMSLVCDRYTCPSVPTVNYYSDLIRAKKASSTTLYYDPKEGFSTQSNCDLMTIQGLASGSINRDDPRAQACEREYEYLWGPGSLTQMNKIFDLSLQQMQKKDGFASVNSGFFNTLSSLCARTKERVSNKKLYIDDREFILEDGQWFATEQIKVGTTQEQQKFLYDTKKPITEFENWFYYKFDAVNTSNVQSIGTAITRSASGQQTTVNIYPVDKTKAAYTSLKLPAVAENNIGVNPDGVLFLGQDVKITGGETIKQWKPLQQQGTWVATATNQPLRLDQLKKEVDALEGADKWLIESTDGLLTSIQSVCVPGIISHLENMKTISEQLKRCFQNLLINDEFSAGYCQQMISEHVCDLVYSLIRCSFKVFEGKPRDTRMESGIPGFFSALSSAGGEVNRDIQDRYGNTVTFDAIFNDRQLVHSMCLGAFNHDWDFNLEAVLEETRQSAVPIKPDVFLFPREMKYYGFNPITGRANLMYNIGAGIVAGADMTYEINLICSNDNSCAEGEGYPGGRCDCAYENRGARTLNIARGRLSKGQSNWDNADQSAIRKLVQDSPFRYDKVEITWQYRDAKNELVTDKVVKPIGLVGPLPDEGCKIDPIAGEFKCLFGFGENGYAKFMEEIKPLQTTFQVGDPIKLKGRIDKYSPEGETYRNIILRAEMYDDAGTLIQTAKDFDMRDDKRYLLETDFGESGVPGYVLSLEDFKNVGGTAGGIVQSSKGTDSKFLLTYPTPYTALVTGDIGTNDVKIILEQNTYYVETSTNVRTKAGDLPDTGNLVIYVNSGTITLPDVKTRMQIGEILTIQPPRSFVTRNYKIRLTIHTIDVGGQINPTPIDEREVVVQVRNSQSSSTCRSDGYTLLTIACDCNGDGTKECGTNEGFKYCYATTVADTPSCNEFKLCNQGEVISVCDCNPDGVLDVNQTKNEQQFNSKFFLSKDLSYNTFKLFRAADKGPLFYTDGDGGRVYLNVTWGNDVTAVDNELNLDNFKYKVYDIYNTTYGEYYYVEIIDINTIAHKLMLDDNKKINQKNDQNNNDKLTPQNSSLEYVFSIWNTIPLSTEAAKGLCEGGNKKYCVGTTCYENDQGFLPIFDPSKILFNAIKSTDTADLVFKKGTTVKLQVTAENTDKMVIDIDKTLNVAKFITMTRVSDKVYEYNWDTSGLSAGSVHSVKFIASRGSLSQTKEYFVENIKINEN